MKNVFSPLHAVLSATLLAAPLAYVRAQTVAEREALLQTIQALDTQLFDAYNHCDLEKSGSFLADPSTLPGHPQLGVGAKKAGQPAD